MQTKHLFSWPEVCVQIGSNICVITYVAANETPTTNLTVLLKEWMSKLLEIGLTVKVEIGDQGLFKALNISPENSHTIQCRERKLTLCLTPSSFV